MEVGLVFCDPSEGPIEACSDLRASGFLDARGLAHVGGAIAPSVPIASS